MSLSSLRRFQRSDANSGDTSSNKLLTVLLLLVKIICIISLLCYIVVVVVLYHHHATNQLKRILVSLSSKVEEIITTSSTNETDYYYYYQQSNSNLDQDDSSLLYFNNNMSMNVVLSKRVNILPATDAPSRSFFDNDYDDDQKYYYNDIITNNDDSIITNSSNNNNNNMKLNKKRLLYNNNYYWRRGNNNRYKRVYKKPNRRQRRRQKRPGPKPRPSEQKEHLKKLNNGGGRPPRGPVVLDNGRSLVAKLRNFSPVPPNQINPMGTVRLNYRNNNEILDSIFVNGSGLGYNYTLADINDDEDIQEQEFDLFIVRRNNICPSGEIVSTESWSDNDRENAIESGLICAVVVYSGTTCDVDDEDDFGSSYWRNLSDNMDPYKNTTLITNNAKTQVKGNTVPFQDEGNGYNLQQTQGRIVVVYNQRGQGVACGVLQ